MHTHAHKLRTSRLVGLLASRFKPSKNQVVLGLAGDHIVLPTQTHIHKSGSAWVNPNR